MIPAGRATIAIPSRADIIVMSLPIKVVAYTSPYPTVVKEMVAQYMASYMVGNVSGSALKITIDGIRLIGELFEEVKEMFDL